MAIVEFLNLFWRIILYTGQKLYKTVSSFTSILHEHFYGHLNIYREIVTFCKCSMNRQRKKSLWEPNGDKVYATVPGYIFLSDNFVSRCVHLQRLSHYIVCLSLKGICWMKNMTHFTGFTHTFTWEGARFIE